MIAVPRKLFSNIQSSRLFFLIKYATFSKFRQFLLFIIFRIFFIHLNEIVGFEKVMSDCVHVSVNTVKVYKYIFCLILKTFKNFLAKEISLRRCVSMVNLLSQI